MQHHDQIASRTYFDRRFQLTAVKLLPGQYYASAEGIGMTTLLGSCVSVCLYDRTSGIGGMNHFMLPGDSLGGTVLRCHPEIDHCANPCSARYGNCAMRHLLHWLERLGARPEQLEAKVFGAGRVMTAGSDVGEKNAEFAYRFLEQRGIPVAASDLGDRCPRRIFFIPTSGQVFVQRLQATVEDTASWSGAVVA